MFMPFQSKEKQKNKPRIFVTAAAQSLINTKAGQTIICNRKLTFQTWRPRQVVSFQSGHDHLNRPTGGEKSPASFGRKNFCTLVNQKDKWLLFLFFFFGFSAL